MQKRIYLFFFLLFFWNGKLPAQNIDPQKWSKHKARRWVKGGSWRNGLDLMPHKTVDAKQFAEQYFKNKESWDKAFAFLKEHDLQKIEKGKYPVDGDKVTASVTTDSSKNFEKTTWESHRKFIDLQYVIMGEEKMGVYPVTKAKVTKPYDEKKDVANYTADGKYYAATPASFFLFFPTDAHRPNITPGGNKVVKKIVLKIKVAE
jgi:YhcH/YjgK/YiaL family protein